MIRIEKPKRANKLKLIIFYCISQFQLFTTPTATEEHLPAWALSVLGVGH